MIKKIVVPLAIATGSPGSKILPLFASLLTDDSIIPPDDSAFVVTRIKARLKAWLVILCPIHASPRVPLVSSETLTAGGLVALRGEAPIGGLPGRLIE